MVIKYRPHKGSLADSMDLAKRFFSVEDMKSYIVKDWNDIIKPKDIVIDEDVIYDDRTKWNTQYVCVKKLGKEKYETPQCIGMCEINKDKDRFRLSDLDIYKHFVIFRNGLTCKLGYDISGFAFVPLDNNTSYCRISSKKTCSSEYTKDLYFNSDELKDSSYDIICVYSLDVDENNKPMINVIWREGE